ncbi:MAG: PaaI family thioesterase [Mycobacteriaceae bacterium]|nr:PaaI family thioesterase [Mycobacteriaceae bacterium]
MSAYLPRDPDYRQRVRESLAHGSRVLTVELKVNLLAPAVGDRLRARGEVLRPGRNLTVCRGDAYTVSSDDANQDAKQVATILATMTAVRSPELNPGPTPDLT